jgi:hypothetical protein
MSSLSRDAQDEWELARLLPTAGIRGQTEQERRATSALLAVMTAVPSFGHALVAGMKAPKGVVSTYAEVRLRDGDRNTHIPDGAVVIERGRTRWACLVEVKTGKVPLATDQVERYLDMAREHGFDGLLTISNQIRSDAKALPYGVDKRKVGNLRVHHLSWWRVLTEAIVQHRFRGVEDPDQAWILGELIRYLDDERSGATGFEDMGEEWVRVREGARNETLRASDPEARSIAARWDQFVEYLCLNLSQELGVDVRQQRSRGKRSADRIGVVARGLASEGVLQSAIQVPDTVGQIAIEANLRTGRVVTSVEVDAPKEGRSKTRLRWLLRQLKDAPEDLRIEVCFSQTRLTRSALLRDCREYPEGLLLPDDPTREPRSFVLAWSKAMGRKRGRKAGSFVSETRRQVNDFYRDLVQDLTPPRTRAPQLQESDPGDDDGTTAKTETDGKIDPDAGSQVASMPPPPPESPTLVSSPLEDRGVVI